jgi:ferritin-like metal-binding protein YciE
VAALKAREPRSDSDDLRQALIDSMQRNVEVDEPEVVVAPMLPPTMRVTLGSRSASFRDPTGVRWKIAADAERLTRGHVVHRSCRPQRQESVMSIKTMDDLFVATLKDIYYAEKQILKALPGMVKKANGKDLKKALETHRQETEGQVERLDQVFKMLEVPARGKKCEAIEGIIDEAKEHIEEIEDEQVLDAGMISSAQAVEHYEICRYGTLIAWASDLGHKDAINLPLGLPPMGFEGLL